MDPYPNPNGQNTLPGPHDLPSNDYVYTAENGESIMGWLRQWLLHVVATVPCSIDDLAQVHQQLASMGPDFVVSDNMLISNIEYFNSLTDNARAMYRDNLPWYPPSVHHNYVADATAHQTRDPEVEEMDFDGEPDELDLDFINTLINEPWEVDVGGPDPVLPSQTTRSNQAADNTQTQVSQNSQPANNASPLGFDFSTPPTTLQDFSQFPTYAGRFRLGLFPRAQENYEDRSVSDPQPSNDIDTRFIDPRRLSSNGLTQPASMSGLTQDQNRQLPSQGSLSLPRATTTYPRGTVPPPTTLLRETPLPNVHHATLSYVPHHPTPQDPARSSAMNVNETSDATAAAQNATADTNTNSSTTVVRRVPMNQCTRRTIPREEADTFVANFDPSRDRMPNKVVGYYWYCKQPGCFSGGHHINIRARGRFNSRRTFVSHMRNVHNIEPTYVELPEPRGTRMTHNSNGDREPSVDDDDDDQEEQESDDTETFFDATEAPADVQNDSAMNDAPATGSENANADAQVTPDPSTGDPHTPQAQNSSASSSAPPSTPRRRSSRVPRRRADR